MSKTPRQKISREQALGAKPVAVEASRREPLKDGGQRIVMTAPVTGWRRKLLRMPEQVVQKFDLDAFGMDILDMCDGQKTVRYIVSRFAKNHNLNPHEAERAVTAFLRTLTQKGVVSMLAPKG